MPPFFHPNTVKFLYIMVPYNTRHNILWATRMPNMGQSTLNWVKHLLCSPMGKMYFGRKLPMPQLILCGLWQPPFQWWQLQWLVIKFDWKLDFAKQLKITVCHQLITSYVDSTPISEVTPVTIRYISPPHHSHTSQYHGHEWMTPILFVPCQSATQFLR